MNTKHGTAYAFSALFFIKALILAFWFTPLGGTPDEFAHFFYVDDLVEGRGIPVVGNAVMGKQMVMDLTGRHISGRGVNQIAQHPPLYYFVAAIPLSIAKLASADPVVWFKSTRVIAAASGAGALIVFYMLLLLLTRSRLVSLGGMACVSFIPMFSNMSSGVSHDTTVTLFSALAVLYWTKYLLGQGHRNAYWCALWLSMACATKMTVLVLAAPMVAIMIARFPLEPRKWVAFAAGVVTVTLFLPGLWMLRNFLLFRNPFMTAVDLPGWYRMEHSPLEHSFFYYLNAEPVVDGFFYSFLTFFMAQKQLIMFQDAMPVRFYSILIAAVLLLGLYRLSQQVMMGPAGGVRERGDGFGSALARWWGEALPARVDGVARVFFLCAAAVSSVAAFELIHAPEGVWERRLVYATLASLLALSPLALLSRLDERPRLALSGLLVVAFFLIVFLLKVYEIYLFDGRLRGIQGRYFFPLSPLLIVGVAAPALEFLRFRAWPVLVAAVAMGLVEVYLFVTHVMPFYRGTQ